MSDSIAIAPTVEVPCAICGGTIVLAFRKHGFAIRRCRGCGFRFVHPPPAGGTAHIYSGGYFRGAASGFGYMDYEADKIAMRPFFNRVLDIVTARRPSAGRLLDVGAATGFFLKLARGRGWVVRGVEVSEYAAGVARAAGCDVVTGTLEAAAFPAESFDVLTMLDVIEHVGDPGKTLGECRRILKPGGILVINTPDTASLWARLFGRRWHAYCPPEHLSYFNALNLGMLLAGRGFRVLEHGRIGKRFTPAYTASMLYRWQGLPVWDRLSKVLERSHLNRLSLPIDIRDNFYLVAERT